MITNFQKRIIALLQESPNGLTSNEIAERVGTTSGNISSRLSKLAAYGIIEARYSHGRNIYRALTYEQGRVLPPEKIAHSRKYRASRVAISCDLPMPKILRR